MFRIVGSTYSLNRVSIEKVALSAFSYFKLNPKDLEIELKFVSTEEITRLNSLYRNKRGPTDVLSFKLDDKPLLGQIFICYNFTKQQAKTHGTNFDCEVALLTVHGILHLLDYDHEEDEDAAKMRKAEESILRCEGVEIQ